MRDFKAKQVAMAALAVLGLSAALLLPMGRAKEPTATKREARRVTTDLAAYGPTPAFAPTAARARVTAQASRSHCRAG